MGAIQTIRQSTPAELQWFCTGLSYAPQMDLKGLTGIDAKGDVVAIIGFDGWTHGSVCLHSWISPGALTRAFMREVARYPFSAGRKVLLGKTPANNEKALRFNKHYGFKEVYRIRDGFADGVDMVIQELRHDECRWYKYGYGHAPANAGSDERCGREHPDAGGSDARGVCSAGIGAASPANPGSAADDCSSQSATGSTRSTTSTRAPDGKQPYDAATDGHGQPAAGSDAAQSGEVRLSRTDAIGALPAATAGSGSSESSCGRSGDTDAHGAHVARRWYSPPGGLADEDVSVEPWCDIKAQLADMERPNSARRAVWLSPRNWQAHSGGVLFGHGYLMVHGLDDQGGVLICRNSHVAQHAQRLVKECGWDVRKVIGRLICAGDGKPEFTPDAVVAQMTDASGAVARESIQPSKAAGYDKIIDWMTDFPGGSGQLVTLEQALSRRESLVRTRAIALAA